MKSKRNLFLIIMSAIFAVVLSCAFIFSIRPTYARDVIITNTDGTSVYITGDGISWDSANNKYIIERDTTIDIHVVNEYRIFQSIIIDGGEPIYSSFVDDYAVTAAGGTIEIVVNASAPTDEDHGKYFSNPYVILDDGYLKSLEAILAGRGVEDDFKKFKVNEDDSNEKVLKNVSTGYFVLNDNILLDTSEFYGIGTQAQPFAGCFDFKGYHVTMNILNQYEIATPNTIYSGFFGYLKGNGTNSSVIRNVDVNGKIAFDGTKENSVYHYIGGVAGYVDANTAITDTISEMSVTTNTDSPMMIGGLFGRLETPLMDKYEYVYKCHYGILQATSTGKEANISIGALAGVIMNASVYSFKDESIATHIVANNLGDGSHNSGSNAVGGIAGTVYASKKNIELKNISMNIQEGKEITSLIDSSSLNEYSTSAGAFGVFDSEGSYKISTKLVPIKVNSGTISITSSTNGESSKGEVYSGGFVGFFDSNGHSLNYDYGPIPNDEDITVFDGNALVASYQYGRGNTYAGGLFGFGALDIDNATNQKIILSSGKDGSTLKVIAEQKQTSKKEGNTFYEAIAGYFSPKVENYKLSNVDYIINNGEVIAQRSVGSTNIGDVIAGGFIGEARADQSDKYNFSNINLTLNNSSVSAFSLSFDSVYKSSDGEYGNNAISGGFIGYLYQYGKANASTSNNIFTWNNPVDGISNINVEVNNYGVNSPDITIYCIQNATPTANGAKDFYTEGYVGGVVGFFENSYAENINFNAINDRAIIYYTGTNNPNTASAGGLVGHSKVSSGNSFGVNGGNVDNAQVVGKAYTDTESGSPFDLYVGGAVGSIVLNSSGGGYFSDLHVNDTTVNAIGEEKMLTFAGGVVGGIYWNTRGYLQDSSFTNGYVYSSSITNQASAGGICGYSLVATLHNNVALNTYVDARSNEYIARAAGVCSHAGSTDLITNNYSQSYVSAKGSNDANTIAAGIAYYTGEPSSTEGGSWWGGGTTVYHAKNNYFDLASFGNSYLSGKPAIPTVLYGSKQSFTGDGSNEYIVLYENDTDRFSSLQLDNPRGAGEIDNANIYTSIDNRFYLKLEGDTETVTRTNNNLKALSNENGLIVSSLWINIYGLTNSDPSVSTLKEEDGWYQFCSYAIKVNNGRPTAETDRLNVELYDNETNKKLHFEYDVDSNGNPYRIDDDQNGTFEKDDPYAVTNSTNVAGLYQFDDYTQYVLVNIGQTGFYENDIEHVAQSIRINASVTNTTRPGYANFPKYSFYEVNNNSNIFDLEESLWTVPYNTSSKYNNFYYRTYSILTFAEDKIYSSAFNGRLSVDRLLDEYALVITPNSELTTRTVILIEYENGTKTPYRVIIEFVPNTIDGLLINPAEDTPPLNVTNNTDQDGDGKNDVVYTYVAGDTIRFEAAEDRRYNQLSFVANVKFNENATYGIKTNGQVNVPNTTTVFPVECSLLSNTNIKGKVFVKVLSKVNLTFNTTGASYSSDRLAVKQTPFNFEFKSSPGFGLAPEQLTIKTDGATYNLAGSMLTHSTTESYFDRNINNILVSFNHLTETYSVVIDQSIIGNTNNLDITIVYPVVYNIVFDTGIPNVSITDRYIVYTLKEGSKLDYNFYRNIYSTVWNDIKDLRYGFTLHDYYLTDDASSIPRYGETFVTMTSPMEKVDKNTGVKYYYFIKNNKLDDVESNRIRVVWNDEKSCWCIDANNNNQFDSSEVEFDYWRTVTGPYTFYARWTYDIALEIPGGISITSPLPFNKVIELHENDPGRGNGKYNLVPINTVNGFSFNIVTDPSFVGNPRFKLFEVTVNDDDEYVYKDLTNYVSLLSGSTSSYHIPQYNELGESIINGVIFLKVFPETIDFEVSDIGEFGTVSVTNDIYEDGIFTTTYGINYSKVVIGGTAYNNGIPVSHTAGGNDVSFKFTDGSDSALNLPANTSFRLYRSINGVAYDAGQLVIDSPANIINVNDFVNLKNGGQMTLDSSLLVKSETYNLVVTLPNGSMELPNISNAKVSVICHYSEAHTQYAYTLTYGYDEHGNLVEIQPRSYDILQSETRHPLFDERAFDLFNIYSYTPASGEVSYSNSRHVLTFKTPVGVREDIFDHRHGNKYYLWEIAKPNVSLPAGYTVSYNDGKTAEFVSETQNYYYYLATNGNLILANAQRNCTIRLLEVDSLSNPAAGIVIYTYSAN